MPTAPLRPCSHAGCTALVPSGACDKHRRVASRWETERRKDDDAVKFRRLSDWTKISRLKREMDPLCCDPFGEHKPWPKPAVHAHHIMPVATHPELARSVENLASLCTRCHARVEAMERAGKATAYLFRK